MAKNATRRKSVKSSKSASSSKKKKKTESASKKKKKAAASKTKEASAPKKKASAPKKKTAMTVAASRSRVADLRQGQYSDGHPLDEVQYLECKLILKPDRFTAAKTFFDYGALVAKTAREFGIAFNNQGIVLNPELREVLFFDTGDFSLYNNAFILRRRIAYEHGFPVGDPEIVFKFRHPDMQTAADLDVRPNIAGNYRIKFKAEALPLKDQVGDFRLLFSHNVEMGLSQVPEGDRSSMATIASVFPCLASLTEKMSDRVELVNQTIVEEVLQDLGTLDFGRGVTANSNIALWRERGLHKPLCGEFAFQAKFKRRDELHEKAIERMKGFFIALQQKGRDWLSLGTTKTGLVYRLHGNPPQAHE
ncbi:MAG: hypothetical protein U0Q11_28610 [Vicinamibacterales bacterium]